VTSTVRFNSLRGTVSGARKTTSQPSEIPLESLAVSPYAAQVKSLKPTEKKDVKDFEGSPIFACFLHFPHWFTLFLCLEKDVKELKGRI
jgi:hypothetical protein